jgi:hypothetical protein
MKKKDLKDEEEIKKSIAMGEYVCKGKVAVTDGSRLTDGYDT